MDQIGFFFLAYGQPKAVNETLTSVRKWYPSEQILLIENGTNCLEEIAEKHNCIYEKRQNYLVMDEIYPYNRIKDEKNIKLFLDQFAFACHKLNCKWIMYLESDVLIRHPITIWPDDDIGIAGCLHEFNIFKPEIIEAINSNLIENKLDEINIKNKEDCFSLSGGSLINQELLSTVLKKKIHFLVGIDKYRELYFQDVLISYIFRCNGYKFLDCNDLCEEKHESNEYRRLMSAVVHSVKYFYE